MQRVQLAQVVSAVPVLVWPTVSYGYLILSLIRAVSRILTHIVGFTHGCYTFKFRNTAYVTNVRLQNIYAVCFEKWSYILYSSISEELQFGVVNLPNASVSVRLARLES